MVKGIGIMLVGAMVALAGCTSYRPAPLSPVVELRALQTRSVALAVPAGDQPRRELGVVGDYQPDDGLDEAELIMVALSFNPALREKRYEVARHEGFDLFSAIRFKPELRVDVDRATVGFATDTDMLYTLLVPSLRQAWRDDEAARRELSRAEMLAAEAEVVVQVRRAHVRVLVGEEHLVLAERRVAHRRELVERLADDPRATPLDRVVAGMALDRALAQAREAHGVVADARRDLNRVVGFDPTLSVRLTAVGQPLVAGPLATLSTDDLDQHLLTGRWELRALEAAYRRAEYTYSQAVMAQMPKLRLAPAVTYDQEEGTSVKFGASLRVPWPEDANERIEDEAVNRERARALYLERLHALRAEAHAALARLTRAFAEYVANERSRRLGEQAVAEGAARFTAGEFALPLYLAMVERGDELHHAGIRAAEDYRLARIDVDHATGRLNRPLPQAP